MHTAGARASGAVGGDVCGAGTAQLLQKTHAGSGVTKARRLSVYPSAPSRSEPLLSPHLPEHPEPSVAKSSRPSPPCSPPCRPATPCSHKHTRAAGSQRHAASSTTRAPHLARVTRHVRLVSPSNTSRAAVVVELKQQQEGAWEEDAGVLVRLDEELRADVACLARCGRFTATSSCLFLLTAPRVLLQATAVQEDEL